MSTVLVTGGSGFIGSHAILQLLAAGHRVRTTVRDLKREGDVRATLQRNGAEPALELSVVNPVGVFGPVPSADFAASIVLVQRMLNGTMPFFNPALRQLVPQVGKIRRGTNNKAIRVLGWSPRSNEEALVATAESLLRL